MNGGARSTLTGRQSTEDERENGDFLHQGGDTAKGRKGRNNKTEGKKERFLSQGEVDRMMDKRSRGRDGRKMRACFTKREGKRNVIASKILETRGSPERLRKVVVYQGRSRLPSKLEEGGPKRSDGR